MVYFLISYALIGLIVALIVARHDYRQHKLNVASAFLGGLLWPVTGLMVFLFNQQKLDTLYARKSRRLQEKRTQQHYRNKRRQ